MTTVNAATITTQLREGPRTLPQLAARLGVEPTDDTLVRTVRTMVLTGFATAEPVTRGGGDQVYRYALTDPQADVPSQAVDIRGPADGAPALPAVLNSSVEPTLAHPPGGVMEATPAPPPGRRRPPPPRRPARSDKPLVTNTWGTGNSEVAFHADGAIGRALEAMGDDKFRDYQGDALANVIGRTATQAVNGQSTTQQVVDQIKEIRDDLPTDSRGHQALRQAVDEIDAPHTPTPVLPDGVPTALHQLMADLHANPAVRRDPREEEQLTDIARRVLNGQLSNLRLIAAVRQLYNQRHESTEGKMEVDRSVHAAVKALEQDHAAARRAARAAAAPAPAPAYPPPAPADEDARNAMLEALVCDVGPGSLILKTPGNPIHGTVSWVGRGPAGGREVRIETDESHATVPLSRHQMYALRDALGATLADPTRVTRFDGGTVTAFPNDRGGYRLCTRDADGRRAEVNLTPEQMRAIHQQLTTDLDNEATAAATFPGVTLRLPDKHAGVRLDNDAQLELPDGAIPADRAVEVSRAVRLYRNGTYRQIHAHLRTGVEATLPIRERVEQTEPSLELVSEHVALIDQAMRHAALDQPMTLWRGGKTQIHNVLRDDDMTGAEWVEPIFPSTSVDPVVAAMFADERVLLRMHVPAGVAGIQLDSRPTEREHTREAEVLLDRDLRMRVVADGHEGIGGGGVYWLGGQRHVAEPRLYRVLDVEVTPAQPAVPPLSTPLQDPVEQAAADLRQMRDDLGNGPGRSGVTRDMARGALDGLTVTQMRDVAARCGLDEGLARGQRTKAALVRYIVEATVGMRLDFDAIRRTAMRR